MKKIKIGAGIDKIGKAELALEFDLNAYEPCNWVIINVKSPNLLRRNVKSTIHVDFDGKATITPLRE